MACRAVPPAPSPASAEDAAAESWCGAVAASIEALSLKYIEEGERSHTVPISAEECERFISEHKERFGSVLCRDLKEKNYDAEGTKCQKTVEDTCELLAEFLAK